MLWLLTFGRGVSFWKLVEVVLETAVVVLLVAASHDRKVFAQGRRECQFQIQEGCSHSHRPTDIDDYNPWPRLEMGEPLVITCCFIGPQSSDTAIKRVEWYRLNSSASLLDVAVGGERVVLSEGRYANPLASENLGGGTRRINFTLVVSGVESDRDVGCYRCEVEMDCRSPSLLQPLNKTSSDGVATSYTHIPFCLLPKDAYAKNDSTGSIPMMSSSFEAVSTSTTLALYTHAPPTSGTGMGTHGPKNGTGPTNPSDPDQTARGRVRQARAALFSAVAACCVLFVVMVVLLAVMAVLCCKGERERERGGVDSNADAHPRPPGDDAAADLNTSTTLEQQQHSSFTGNTETRMEDESPRQRVPSASASGPNIPITKSTTTPKKTSSAFSNRDASVVNSSASNNSVTKAAIGPVSMATPKTPTPMAATSTEAVAAIVSGSVSMGTARAHTPAVAEVVPSVHLNDEGVVSCCDGSDDGTEAESVSAVEEVHYDTIMPPSSSFSSSCYLSSSCNVNETNDGGSPLANNIVAVTKRGVVCTRSRSRSECVDAPRTRLMTSSRAVVSSSRSLTQDPSTLDMHAVTRPAGTNVAHDGEAPLQGGLLLLRPGPAGGGGGFVDLPMSPRTNSKSPSKQGCSVLASSSSADCNLLHQDDKCDSSPPLDSALSSSSHAPQRPCPPSSVTSPRCHLYLRSEQEQEVSDPDVDPSFPPTRPTPGPAPRGHAYSSSSRPVSPSFYKALDCTTMDPQVEYTKLSVPLSN